MLVDNKSELPVAFDFGHTEDKLQMLTHRIILCMKSTLLENIANGGSNITVVVSGRVHIIHTIVSGGD